MTRNPPGADPEQPPSQYCTKHPNGTDEPCGACGRARLRYLTWTKAATQRDADRAKAIANCPDCAGTSWLVNPDTGQSTRCDHPAVAAP